MVAKYGQHYSKLTTPQSEAIPGREEDMTKNYAGGFTFKVDDWERLNRFLILNLYHSLPTFSFYGRMPPKAWK